MRAGLGGEVLVAEGRPGWDRALRYVRHAVHVRRDYVMLAVPMHRGAAGVQHVDHVDDYPVALAHLQSRRIPQTIPSIGQRRAAGYRARRR